MGMSYNGAAKFLPGNQNLMEITQIIIDGANCHPWPNTLPQFKVPVLHKVMYANTVDHVQAMYQRSYKDHLVDTWLKENCRSPYYHSPGYLREKSIHFECDEDAALFALSCV